MIKYFCEVCNDYISDIEKSRDTNTNRCTVCKRNLEIMHEKLKLDEISKFEYDKAYRQYQNNIVKMEKTIFWCDNCNVPLFDEVCSNCKSKGRKLTTDIKPVFPEEQLLLEILLKDEIKLIGKSVWYTGGNKYVVDGKTIKASKNSLKESNSEYVIKELQSRENEIEYSAFDMNIEKFINANKKRLNEIETQTMSYIKKIASDYDDDEIFVSFSGGKDSTVVYDIVRRALSGRNILGIFGDTTLEFKYTYDYVKRFKEDDSNGLILQAKNKKDDFYELVDVIGPPSRVMRWCCTFFKTGPISDRIDRLFKNKKKILSFQGIRRPESVSRSKYEKETNSPKIAKQLASAPIIDWLDFDVWLYLLSNKVDFNDAYRMGYARVGCWCCPNNTSWDMYLSKIYMPEKSKDFYSSLFNFALKTNKTDPESYVNDGSWKARQGGNGLAISNNTFVEFKPCVNESDSFSYELKKPISDSLYELFIPFGDIDKNMGNERKGEVYIVDRDKMPIIKLQGRIGSNHLKVTIISFNFAGLKNKIKNINDAKGKIECQLSKYQLCVACGGCQSACKYNAISIRKSINDNLDDKNYQSKIEYHIDEKKCVKCGACVDHYQGGCYMKKVLRIKRGE